MSKQGYNTGNDRPGDYTHPSSERPKNGSLTCEEDIDAAVPQELRLTNLQAAKKMGRMTKKSIHQVFFHE